jgi:hypothetical protein
MFGNNRNELRQVYLSCWQLKKNRLPMDPMQEVVANIVEKHPEYHQLLEQDEIVDKDFSADTGESNPFLHMSMHIALHEQISTNRPDGINEECLGEALWLAQRNQAEPDESKYLGCLKKIAQIS